MNIIALGISTSLDYRVHLKVVHLGYCDSAVLNSNLKVIECNYTEVDKHME